MFRGGELDVETFEDRPVALGTEMKDARVLCLLSS